MENIQGEEGIYASLDLFNKGRITGHDLGLTLLPGSQIQTEGGHQREEINPCEQNVASGEEQGGRAVHDVSRTAGKTQTALALVPCRNVQPRDLARSDIRGHAVLDRNTLKRKGSAGSQVQTEGGHEVEEVDPSEQNVASGEEQGGRAVHDASRTAEETQIAPALAPCRNVQPRDLTRSDVGGHAVLDRNNLKRKGGDGRKGAAETTYGSEGDEGDLGDDESKKPRGNWTRKVLQSQKRRRLTKDVVPGGDAVGSRDCQRLSRMWRMKGGKRTSLLIGVQGNTSLMNQPQPPSFPPPESVLVSSRHSRSTSFYVSDNSTDSETSTFTSESGHKVRITRQRAPVAQKASIFPNSQPKTSLEPVESFERSPVTENRQNYSQQVSRAATAPERQYRSHRSRPAPAKALAPTDSASFSIPAASGLLHPIYSTAPGLNFISNPSVEQLQNREQHLLSPDRERSSASQSPKYTQVPVEAKDRSRLRASSSTVHPHRSEANGTSKLYSRRRRAYSTSDIPRNQEACRATLSSRSPRASAISAFTSSAEMSFTNSNPGSLRPGASTTSSPVTSSYRYQSQGSTDPSAANDNIPYPIFYQSQGSTDPYVANDYTIYANVYQSQSSTTPYAENDNTSYPNFGQSQGSTTPYAAIDNTSYSNFGQSQGSITPYAAIDNTSSPNFGQSQSSTTPYAAIDNTSSPNFGQSQSSTSPYAAIDNTSYSNFSSQSSTTTYAENDNTSYSNFGQSQGSTIPYAEIDNTSYSNFGQSQGSTIPYTAIDRTSDAIFGQSQSSTNQYAGSNNIVNANYGQSRGSANLYVERGRPFDARSDANYDQSWGNANLYVERGRPFDASSDANVSYMGSAHEQTPWLPIADANTPLDTSVLHSNVARPSQVPHASMTSEHQFRLTPYGGAILGKICTEITARKSDEKEIYEWILKFVQTFPISGKGSVPAGQCYSNAITEKLKGLKARVTEVNEELRRLKDEAAEKDRATLLQKQLIDQLRRKNQWLEELLNRRPLPQVKPAAAVIGEQERRMGFLGSEAWVPRNPPVTVDLTGGDTAPAPAVTTKRKAAPWLEGYNPLDKHPRLSLHGEPTPHEQHLQREPQAGANSGSGRGQSVDARKRALKDAANARRRAKRAEEKRRREEEEAEWRAVEEEERAEAEGEAEAGGVDWEDLVASDGEGDVAGGEEVAAGEEVMWGEEDVEGETDEVDMIAADLEEAWAREEEADAAEGGR